MDESEARALILAAEERLDLRIDPAFLDGVAVNLALLHRHADGFMRFPAEIAPS